MYIFFYHNTSSYIFYFFFFNDTATTEIYTLSLHDALPISSDTTTGHMTEANKPIAGNAISETLAGPNKAADRQSRDRKSTRLNSSHLVISYAVFCLKKKKKIKKHH